MMEEARYRKRVPLAIPSELLGLAYSQLLGYSTGMGVLIHCGCCYLAGLIDALIELF